MVDPVVERAVAYPFEIPSQSYVFDPRAGTATPLAHFEPSARTALCTSREAVLALGSNAAPQQLRAKFWDSDATEPIPVIRTRVRDHDVVYAARVASYGAVPATIEPSPGTTVSVHTTFLTEAQLEWMNSTESVGEAYQVAELAPTAVDFEIELGEVPTTSSYVALAGPLLIEGLPVALAAIHADNRRFPSWEEREVLAHLAASTDLTLEQFVHRAVEDGAFRTLVNARLSSDASALGLRNAINRTPS